MRKQICRLDEKKKPTNFLNTRLLLKELRATRNTQVTNTDLVFAYLNISAFIKSLSKSDDLGFDLILKA